MKRRYTVIHAGRIKTEGKKSIGLKKLVRCLCTHPNDNWSDHTKFDYFYWGKYKYTCPACHMHYWFRHT